MGGFTNAVVGGASTLIRIAIQSANYVAGVSGWSIQKNGNAEFNRVTIRGAFFAGVSNGPDGAVAIQAFPGIGGDINLYPIPSNVAGVTWQAATIFTSRTEASVSPVTTTPYLQLLSPAVLNPTALHAAVLVLRGQSSASTTDDSNMFLQMQSMSFRTTSNGSPGDMGGGWVGGAVSTSSITAVTSGTEVVQMLPTDGQGFQITYSANRIYKVIVYGNIQTSAVATAPFLHVRKSTITGQDFGFMRYGPTVAGFPYGFVYECQFKVGAANISANLVLTLAGGAGQSVQLIAPTVNSPIVMDVYDMGDVNTRPNYAPSLTTLV